jgi:hypothetical protein
MARKIKNSPNNFNKKNDEIFVVKKWVCQNIFCIKNRLLDNPDFSDFE